MKKLLISLCLLLSFNAFGLYFPTHKPHEFSVIALTSVKHLKELKETGKINKDEMIYSASMYKTQNKGDHNIQINNHIMDGVAAVDSYYIYSLNKHASLSLGGAIDTKASLKAGASINIHAPNIDIFFFGDHHKHLKVGFKYYFLDDTFHIGLVGATAYEDLKSLDDLNVGIAMGFALTFNSFEMLKKKFFPAKKEG